MPSLDLPSLAKEGPFPGSMSLAVDVKEDENAFVISADLPGVNKDQVKVCRITTQPAVSVV